VKLLYGTDSFDFIALNFVRIQTKIFENSNRIQNAFWSVITLHDPTRKRESRYPAVMFRAVCDRKERHAAPTEDGSFTLTPSCMTRRFET
jgi:hypothetical protein